MKTIREVLTLSTEYLEKKVIHSARKQVQQLCSSILHMSCIDLYMKIDQPLLEEEVLRLREAIKRRGQGEPWQYIIGSVEFLGCKIKVNQHTLIPRQETEILADMISKELPLKPLEIWDIATGSGCIGIALKKKRKDCHVVLSDISPKALELACDNAKANGVDVDCVLGDLFEPFFGKKADVIVCNPPYISIQEYQQLDREVRDWEPRNALIGGVSGYEYYEKMAESLPKYLKQKGIVYFEIGYQMGERIKKIFDNFGSGTLLKDWSSHDRYYKVEIE